MIEPTERLLRLCDEYGAKLTIMADVAEILKFKEYKDRFGRDDYYYDAIVEQLCHAIKGGHDVQLHLHSSYFKARYDNGRWVQDWSEYNFAGLPYERMDWMVRAGKEFLETLIQQTDPGYRCKAFRAANWSVSPSSNVVRALVQNGIEIDTSVFKYGRRNGMVTFDYSRAYSPLVPWRVSGDDICIRDDAGRLWELPIYSEKRWIGAFLTLNRIYRALMGWRHKIRYQDGPHASQVSQNSADASRTGKRVWLVDILQRRAWKADFNQCMGKQLIHALHRASNKHDLRQDLSLPFVLIGHSKLFTKINERSLRPFLAHVARNTDKFAFDTLIGLNRSRKQWETL